MRRTLRVAGSYERTPSVALFPAVPPAMIRRRLAAATAAHRGATGPRPRGPTAGRGTGAARRPTRRTVSRSDCGRPPVAGAVAPGLAGGSAPALPPTVDEPEPPPQPAKSRAAARTAGARERNTWIATRKP